MDAYTAKLVIKSSLTCQREGLVNRTLEESKIEMERYKRTFSFTSLTGIKMIDRELINEIVRASRASDWDGYYSSLESFIFKIERYFQFLNEHGDSDLSVYQDSKSMLLYVLG
ncbi:hypothetical protein [Vibrio sinaloensis]|uniref:hypothetical protein n=1 Tax=Photobacterium sp. (strain ATCC 43367) TaxID=379097 RepID=UPI0035EFBF33